MNSLIQFFDFHSLMNSSIRFEKYAHFFVLKIGLDFCLSNSFITSWESFQSLLVLVLLIVIFMCTHISVLSSRAWYTYFTFNTILCSFDRKLLKKMTINWLFEIASSWLSSTIRKQNRSVLHVSVVLILTTMLKTACVLARRTLVVQISWNTLRFVILFGCQDRTDRTCIRGAENVYEICK